MRSSNNSLTDPKVLLILICFFTTNDVKDLSIILIIKLSIEFTVIPFFFVV